MARRSYTKDYESVDLVIPVKTRADAIKLAQSLREHRIGGLDAHTRILVRREDAVDRQGKLRLRVDTEAGADDTLWSTDAGPVREHLTEDDMLDLAREGMA
jgi:hypothetical protein